MANPAERRFTRYSDYLRRRHGAKVFRVAVDAGFSCPNRPCGRFSPGCIYCDIAGSRASYLGSTEELDRQVSGAVSFLSRRYRAQAFCLYFQAYSGTNAPVETLRRIYDRTLGLQDFRELVVSTRPDCVDEKRADLLASYIGRVTDVWVELGLQSPKNATLKRIDRGHTTEDFERAFDLLRTRGIKIGVHLMFGLPGEGMAEVIEAAAYIDRIAPEGVKVHNLRILEGTPLYRLALRGDVALLGSRRYIEYLGEFLPRIPSSVVVLRLGFDPPRERAVLPTRFLDKADLYRAVDDCLRAAGRRQGSLAGATGRPPLRQPS